MSDEFYNIFQTEKRGRQKPNKGPSRWNRPQTDGFVRLPKELWNVISDEFKQIIYDHNKNLTKNPPNTALQTNMQALDIEDEDHLEPNEPEPPDKV